MRTTNTLSDREHIELKSLAPEAVVSFQQEIAGLTERLREAIRRGDPLLVLAAVKAENLLATSGSYYEPTFEGLESNVELVAGLLLTQAPSAETGAPSAATISEVKDLLIRLGDVTTLRNLAAASEHDAETGLLQFSSVIGWMSLRGTSYEHHGAELALAVCAPYAEVLSTSYGFTAEDVIAVAQAERDLTEARGNALVPRRLLAAMKEALDQARGGDTGAALRSQEGASDAETAGLLQALKGLDPLGGGALEDHGDAAAFVFVADDLVSDSITRERVDAVLAELSVSVGSLREDAYNGLFDESPLVDHPFVEFEGRYVLAVPGMVLRDALGLLETRLKARPGFSRSRAKTLDGLAVRYLETLLPGCIAATNLFYEGTELDGIVIFERTAFVVEGKAMPLSVPAQRGDIKRLAGDLRDGIEKAWRQGKRARDYILSDAQAVFTHKLGKSRRELLTLEPGDIDEVIIVTPTIHQMAGHASQLPRLRSLGLFADGEYPWSVFINDLRVIAETADNPAVFLHYLVWRSRLPLGDQVVVGDEIDLWSSYLLGERFHAIADGIPVTVANSSTDFDAFYDGVLGNGPPAAKPSKFLREPIKSFVESQATEQNGRWLDAAGACLELSIPELAYACRSSDRIAGASRDEGEVLIEEAGRVRLVGVPPTCSLGAAARISGDHLGEAVLHFYCRTAEGGQSEIVWAETAGPITFAPSEWEKAASAELARHDW